MISSKHRQTSVPIFYFLFTFEFGEDCTEVGTVKLLTADLLKHTASSQKGKISMMVAHHIY